MRTRYILHTGGESIELTGAQIRNWDQIRCAYSRKNFDGLVRSFSSNFEFVDEAYHLLLDLYLSQGLNAYAVLSVETITDSWEWTEQFRASLDFSTISWDGKVLSIAAVDNTLAALISAHKSTKYEFMVGKDIPSETLSYDRVRMQNLVTHEIMGNTDNTSQDEYVIIKESNLDRLPAYTVGSGENYENSPILCRDQTSNDGSCFVEVMESVELLEMDIEICSNGTVGENGKVDSFDIYLMRYPKGKEKYSEEDYINIGTLFHQSDKFGDRMCVGTFDTFENLVESYPNPPQNVYAIVSNSAHTRPWPRGYYTAVGEIDTPEWIAGAVTKTVSGNKETTICTSARYIRRIVLTDVPKGTCFALFYAAKFSPITVGHITIGKPSGMRIKSKIQTKWSSRGKAINIDSMSPVDVVSAVIDRITAGRINVCTRITNDDSRLVGTRILAAESIRGLDNAKLYTSFGDFCDWMSAVFGYTYTLMSDLASGTHEIVFSHRSRVFDGKNEIILENCKNLKFNIDSSIIYSNVSAGYDKQDYDAECGRDEWNFTNNYTTGLGISDKTLKLLSKYRADCYGIEFLSQKRTKDTTDDKSDDSVFFLRCRKVDETETEYSKFVVDRSICVDGALSDTVFNGEYSPRHCIEANADYISAMIIPLELSYVSADGNSGVIIAGTAEDSDFRIDSRLFSAGVVSFTTDYVDAPKDIGSLISFYDNGLKYSGFISSLELKYAKTEAAKYKLIIKSIEP